MIPNPRKLYSAGRAFHRWPCDSITRIKTPEDFFPSLASLSQQGFEVELWVGGAWLNGRLNKRARFPAHFILAADDWKVNLEEKVIDTTIFSHLKWAGAIRQWKLRNPISATDPWHMTYDSVCVLMGFKSRLVISKPALHPFQSPLNPGNGFSIGPLAGPLLVPGRVPCRSRLVRNPRNVHPVVNRRSRNTQ